MKKLFEPVSVLQLSYILWIAQQHTDWS